MATALRNAGDVADVRLGEDPAADEIPHGTMEFNVAELAQGVKAPTATGAVSVPKQRSVRIDLRRLDNLMNLIGELVITRGRLMQLAGASKEEAHGIADLRQ